jgi:hypothetical protein
MSSSANRNAPILKEVFVYRATEDVTVERPYEEKETGFTAFEGTFLDGSNEERRVNCVMPDKRVLSDPDLYSTHNRLANLQQKSGKVIGSVLKCTGTMRLSIQSSPSRINMYFSLEVHTAIFISEPSAAASSLKKAIYPVVEKFKKGGIAAQLNEAYPSSARRKGSIATKAPPHKRHRRTIQITDESSQGSSEELSAEDSSKGTSSTSQVEEVNTLANQIQRSLSANENQLPPPTTRASTTLTNSERALLQDIQWTSSTSSVTPGTAAKTTTAAPNTPTTAKTATTITPGVTFTSSTPVTTAKTTPALLTSTTKQKKK